MSEHFLLSSENYDAVKTAAVASLRAGDVVCMAMDGAYVYAAYAFDQNAVYAIHRMRESNPGTQLQVLVGDSKTIAGIATHFTEDLAKLGDKFWPGPLTVLITPNKGLAWDLGDNGELDEFAVRVPQSKFIRDVVSATGPVAIASASIAGLSPTTSINFVQGDSVALYIDEGDLDTLQEGLRASTVVRAKRDGGCEVVREGAISLSQISAEVALG
jgi:tRNA threonylcarbamoyl adenosine modification protein (Sua5/YciO/YrdC/YwlC family)